MPEIRALCPVVNSNSNIQERYAKSVTAFPSPVPLILAPEVSTTGAAGPPLECLWNPETGGATSD
jgi:hypothetical protein